MTLGNMREPDRPYSFRAVAGLDQDQESTRAGGNQGDGMVKAR
jgi:hypothetical protein